MIWYLLFVVFFVLFSVRHRFRPTVLRKLTYRLDVGQTLPYIDPRQLTVRQMAYLDKHSFLPTFYGVTLRSMPQGHFYFAVLEPGYHWEKTDQPNIIKPVKIRK